jgi:hypothetical protein
MQKKSLHLASQDSHDAEKRKRKEEKRRRKKKEEGSPRKGWVLPEGSGLRPDTSRPSTETHGWVSLAVGWFFFFFFFLLVPVSDFFFFFF